MGETSTADIPEFGLATTATIEADGRVVVHVRGELDLGTVPQFLNAVDDALEHSPSAIVLDLESLLFIDSSGVGAYVAAFRRARSRHVELSIGPRSAAVERVLELSGVEEALAAEAGGRAG